MSRYRPPRPAGTPLITPEGEARLRAELHELWHVKRPQVTQSVSEAAAQGDRSENAEYTYGKKMLREIDSRVRFLTKRLEKLKVVSERPSDPGKVYFGAWVTLEDEDGEQARYRIGGPDELELKQGLISIDSPLARALVGKPLDAEVRVQTPTGDKLWYIVAIDYQPRKRPAPTGLGHGARINRPTGSRAAARPLADCVHGCTPG